MKSRFSASGMPPMLIAAAEFEDELAAAGRAVVRVMAVDPGVITGVSVLWIDAATGEIVGWAETLIAHDETKQVWDLLELLRVLADAGQVWIAIEDFRVQMVNMAEDFLSPVRIGRQFAFGADIMRSGLLFGPVWGKIHEVSWQGNGRKADYSDERLKKLGFYTPGPDHRRDATRHALVRWKRLKLELTAAGGGTLPGVWEPAVIEPELPKSFGRSFNGKPTDGHGGTPAAGVSKEDMQRIALAAGRRLGKSTELMRNMVEAVKNGKLTMLATEPGKEVSDVMKAAAETNGMRWVPMPGGAAGWVLEHDPATQSGIAPRSGPAQKSEKTAPKEVLAKPQDKSQPSAGRRRRMVKKLV